MDGIDFFIIGALCGAAIVLCLAALRGLQDGGKPSDTEYL